MSLCYDVPEGFLLAGMLQAMGGGHEGLALLQLPDLLQLTIQSLHVSGGGGKERERGVWGEGGGEVGGAHTHARTHTHTHAHTHTHTHTHARTRAHIHNTAHTFSNY